MHRNSLGLTLNVHNAAGSSDKQNSSERLEITSSETSTLEEVYQGPAYQFENCDHPEELQYDV